MSNKQNDYLVDNILVWLNERGRAPNDVMTDDQGRHYVLMDGENGLYKDYLPDLSEVLSGNKSNETRDQTGG